jgi:dTMP kinase
MFITFEGPEGCGKSTQSRLLADFLREGGRDVVLTMEPGGTALGIELRQLLLHSDKNLEKDSELYFFAADRNEHVKKIIAPALLENKIVICDRYTDSTLAYQ